VGATERPDGRRVINRIARDSFDRGRDLTTTESVTPISGPSLRLTLCISLSMRSRLTMLSRASFSHISLNKGILGRENPK
jgi:hypothetical protein